MQSCRLLVILILLTPKAVVNIFEECKMLIFKEIGFTFRRWHLNILGSIILNPIVFFAKDSFYSFKVEIHFVLKLIRYFFQINFLVLAVKFLKFLFGIFNGRKMLFEDLNLLFQCFVFLFDLLAVLHQRQN